MTSSSFRTPNSLSTTPAWIAIGLFTLISWLAGLLGLGKILNLTFPAAAFFIAIFLFFRYPLFYNSFTWWIWFITPLARRFFDYHSSYTEPSPVLLAPILVTCVSGISVLRHLPKSFHHGGLPFLLSLMGVFYGFLIGLIRNSRATVILDFLGWLTPLLFAFHLFINWRNYPQTAQNIQKVFVWGCLLMGSYGIWQYLVAPEWDKVWLQNSKLVSFGIPEPLGIRVWSTLNSPQTFGGVIGAGLILLFTQQSSWQLPAIGTGYLSFLLSSARSAWLSWVVGILVFLTSLKSNLQIRLIVTIFIAALVVVSLATIEPFSTVISDRVESLSNAQNDSSYQARTQGYNDLLGKALIEFTGRGIGSEVRSDSLGSRDSGFFTLLFSLGWLGTIPYIGGIFLILIKLFQGSESRFDPFVSASRAIALGTLSQIGLNIVMSGAIGMVLWSFLAMGIAAQKYYKWQDCKYP